jgi:hypothetical protein
VCCRKAPLLGRSRSSAVKRMDALWTWGGKYFGNRDADNLWTYKGKHVGRFVSDEVFGSDGRYLGELRNGNRLITNRSKKNRRSTTFMPFGRRGSHVKYVDYVGYVMYVGHEDFPAPEAL